MTPPMPLISAAEFATADAQLENFMAADTQPPNLIDMGAMRGFARTDIAVTSHEWGLGQECGLGQKEGLGDGQGMGQGPEMG